MQRREIDELHTELQLDEDIQRGGRPAHGQPVRVVQHQKDDGDDDGAHIHDADETVSGQGKETDDGENDGNDAYGLEEDQSLTAQNGVLTCIEMAF